MKLLNVKQALSLRSVLERLILPVLSVLAGVFACVPAYAQLSVLVSTNPLARLVTNVSNTGQVEVITLLDRGVTPHDAVLRPRQLQQLVQADLVVWMGPDIEPYLAIWMKKRTGPTLDISALDGIKRLPMREQAAHSAHEHGHTHHSRFDIHLWWSRHNLTLSGNAVADRLVAMQPDLHTTIEQARHSFVQDMAQLDKTYAPGSADFPAFAVFHDGWQYLEHDLGQTASAGFVLDGELSMGVKHLAELQARFKTHPVQCVLLEPGMNTSLVNKILPGTPTITLDPLGWDAPGQSVADLLRHAYEQLLHCAKN